MNVPSIVICGAVALGVAWYALTVVVGIVRLWPQIVLTHKLAQQRWRSLRVAALDIESLLSEARKGNAAAQTRAGLMLATGDGCLRDEYKALALFRSAANSGFVEAQYYLGLTYEYGLSVQCDYDNARIYYENAARNGHPGAQCNLGVLELRGAGRLTDWITAAYWFLKAAAACSHREAIHNLRWIIERRDALPSDSMVTLARYRTAAVRGDIDAQYLLAWCYEHGVGVPTSGHNAAVWYERAMRCGHMHAKGALARLQSDDAFSAAVRSGGTKRGFRS